MIYREQPSPGYEQLKSMALAFVRRMKVGEEPGAYKKEACESGPSTYGAYHAAVILSLFGELDREGRENLDRWAERINALQCPGGYFSNRPGDAARRRGPDETVRLAMSRVGETGYDILRNNCEHFANACAFTEARPTALDGLRAAIRGKLKRD